MGFLRLFFEVCDLPPGRDASQGRAADCRCGRDLVIAGGRAAAACVLRQGHKPRANRPYVHNLRWMGAVADGSLRLPEVYLSAIESGYEFSCHSLAFRRKWKLHDL